MPTGRFFFSARGLASRVFLPSEGRKKLRTELRNDKNLHLRWRRKQSRDSWGKFSNFSKSWCKFSSLVCKNPGRVTFGGFQIEVPEFRNLLKVSSWILTFGWRKCHNYHDFASDGAKRGFSSFRPLKRTSNPCFFLPWSGRKTHPIRKFPL